MHFQPADGSRRFSVPGATFTTLSAPTLGARENAVWFVQVSPGSPGAPHRISREETFVALNGKAVASVDGQAHELAAGSALVVPAGALLTLTNPGPDPFEAIAVMPVGAVVSTREGDDFVPPWAA